MIKSLADSRVKVKMLQRFKVLTVSPSSGGCCGVAFAFVGGSCVCTRGGLDGIGASFPSSSQYYFMYSFTKGKAVLCSVVFLDFFPPWLKLLKIGFLSSVVPLDRSTRL